MKTGIRKYRNGPKFRRMYVDFHLTQGVLEAFMAEYWFAEEPGEQRPSQATAERWIRSQLHSGGMPEGLMPYSDCADAEDLTAAQEWAKEAVAALWPEVTS